VDISVYVFFVSKVHSEGGSELSFSGLGPDDIGSKPEARSDGTHIIATGGDLQVSLVCFPLSIEFS
jgi:hypothetical protein